jgi:hypothetical protein
MIDDYLLISKCCRIGDVSKWKSIGSESSFADNYNLEFTSANDINHDTRSGTL